MAAMADHPEDVARITYVCTYGGPEDCLEAYACGDIDLISSITQIRAIGSGILSIPSTHRNHHLPHPRRNAFRARTPLCEVEGARSTADSHTWDESTHSEESTRTWDEANQTEGRRPRGQFRRYRRTICTRSRESRTSSPHTGRLRGDQEPGRSYPPRRRARS